MSGMVTRMAELERGGCRSGGFVCLPDKEEGEGGVRDLHKKA